MTAAEASCAEVSLSDPSTLRITGPIEYQTADEFFDLFERNPNIRTIELNSSGGLIYAALRIADKISAAGLNTWIRSSSRCASSCSIIFLAGRLRLADGELGVHQISGVEDPSATQLVIGDIHSALTRFRTPQKLISIMLRTPPDDLYVFSRSELNKWGINVRHGEQASQVQPHLQVVTSQVFKDWLVGTFLNTHTHKPFFAMESREMDPVFRLVHYPHSMSTFFRSDLG